MPNYGRPVDHPCLICSKLVQGTFSPTCAATSCKRMYKAIKLERTVTVLLTLGVCTKCGRDLLANGEPALKRLCTACGNKKKQENQKHRDHQQKQRREGEKIRQAVEARHRREQIQKDRIKAGLRPVTSPNIKLPKGAEISEEV